MAQVAGEVRVTVVGEAASETVEAVRRCHIDAMLPYVAPGFWNAW